MKRERNTGEIADPVEIVTPLDAAKVNELALLGPEVKTRLKLGGRKALPTVSEMLQQEMQISNSRQSAFDTLQLESKDKIEMMMFLLLLKGRKRCITVVIAKNILYIVQYKHITHYLR